MNKKIDQLIYRPLYTKAVFDLDFDTDDFPGHFLVGAGHASGYLMKVEDGIMLVLEELEAKQELICVKCGKKLKRDLRFVGPSEWTFYEQLRDKPLLYEELKIDLKKLEIDAGEPVRQEIVLHTDQNQHCEKNCTKFEESKEEGVKALAGLKDMIKS